MASIYFVSGTRLRVRESLEEAHKILKDYYHSYEHCQSLHTTVGKIVLVNKGNIEYLSED